ncbi:MAG: hypothetical protein SFX18_10650 [Pirellulales bacterium]|nr:hypothetical protein [Pirellulales bacterium]
MIAPLNFPQLPQYSQAIKSSLAHLELGLSIPRAIGPILGAVLAKYGIEDASSAGNSTTATLRPAGRSGGGASQSSRRSQNPVSRRRKRNPGNNPTGGNYPSGGSQTGDDQTPNNQGWLF